MKLVDAGCKVVMPWASPIGSARGITNRDALKLLRARLPDITLVVDAGIGAPSHAAEAFELGYDAVLLNTAIAKADDPVAMGNAFRLAAEAGRAGYEAGLMGARAGTRHHQTPPGRRTPPGGSPFRRPTSARTGRTRAAGRGSARAAAVGSVAVGAAACGSTGASSEWSV